MAIKLNIAYSKKLGLPQYSSHSASASVEIELTDVERAPGEVARLYLMLQASIDRALMQQPGFVPDDSYATAASGSKANGSAAHHQLPVETPAAPNGGSAAPTWQCSAKQHQLINDLARRIGLDVHQLDERAQRLFSKPAHQLNKLSASGLISDLLAEAGPRRSQTGTPSATPANRNGGGA